MNRLLKIQLEKAFPLTYEECEELEETTFYMDDDPEKMRLNLKYKFYFSGREKKVGDIVLIAVLAYYEMINGKKDVILQTITIHPEEMNDLYEDFEVQPTVNNTLIPVVGYKKEKIAKEVDNLLDKITNGGMSSLSEEELKFLKRQNLN